MLVVFAISCIGYAQKNMGGNTDLWVSYEMNYKKIATEELSQSTNAMLIVTNQGSLFTFVGC